MSKPLVLCVALVALGVRASAQSINVDFQPANSAFGVPSPNYGGSAGAPGVWNPVSSTSVTNLRRWDGVPTGVSLSTTSTLDGCGGLFYGSDHPGTSGEDEALLDDRYSADDGLVIWTFSGLAPGLYIVDTIIVDETSCLLGTLQVDVLGSPDPTQYVGGRWNGAYVQGTNNQFDFNANFTRHTKSVSDGILQVSVGLGLKPHDYVRICGIQLNAGEQDFIGTFQCFGDGTAGACPCANSGFPAFGCQNSAGTGGAFLHASGTTSPDTVVLHASGEMPTALTIFLQGNATVGPLAFGDGLRCAGGILKRLYNKSASGGAVSAPAPGDLSITARSAALGDPIPTGERRYYQTYYRDANPSFCPAPTGNTFNASSAVKIVW